jgi:hypothetical protein
MKYKILFITLYRLKIEKMKNILLVKGSDSSQSKIFSATRENIKQPLISKCSSYINGKSLAF